MDISSPENRFLEQGKSSELSACLQIIQETTADDGPKYTEKTCRDLARIIVCRSYAPAVLELCHLVVAAVHAGSYDQRYEALFFSSGSARSSRFRAYFPEFEDCHKQIEIGAREVTLTYSDAPFAVTYGRMPLLSALMEFLMTALGYAPLDDALKPLIADVPSFKRVSEVANDLSRLVYAYLGDHLPPVQEQRKSQSFLHFVSEKKAGELATDTITDESVLEYWVTHSAGAADDQSVDVKTYRSVFRMAAHLVRVLRYAEDQYKMNGALPIGTDYESGEVDPSDLEAALAEIEADAHPLSELETVINSGVKFANKRELSTLGEALHGDDIAGRLAVSILRNAVFGDAQASLVQVLRQAKTPDKANDGAQDMADALAELPKDTYDMRIGGYANLLDHLEQMLLASFHVLARAGNGAAASIALAIRPNLDVSELITDTNEPEWGDSNVVSFQAEGAMGRFFDRVANDADGDLGVLAQQAETAFKNISRQGFSNADVQKDEIIELFKHGSSALIALRKELHRFLETHTASTDWHQQLSADTPLFRTQFTTLYGGQNG